MSPSSSNNHLPVQGVAFDLDGLMVNTEFVFHKAGHELARRRGKRMTEGVFQQMMGRRTAEAFAVMIECLELSDTIEALNRESEEVFFGLLDEHLRLMPGLLNLLDELERRKLPKAVTTSSPRDYTQGILERFSLRDRFQFLLTAEDVTQGKPNPEIYSKAAERLGVPPGRMMVLEDSEAGTKAAAAASALVVAVPHEFSEGHDLSAAHYVANQLDDPGILRLLDRGS